MSESREYYSRSEQYGDVYISEEVLEMIAGAAVRDMIRILGSFGNQTISPSTYPSRSAMAVSFLNWPKRFRKPSLPVWRPPAA